MNSASVFAGTDGMHHDDEVGIIDRRDRRQIPHQFVFALVGTSDSFAVWVFDIINSV